MIFSTHDILASVYITLANAWEHLSSQVELFVRAHTVLQGLNYNGMLTTVVVVAHNNAMAPQRRAQPIICTVSASARTYIRARERLCMCASERRDAPTAALYLYRVIIVLVLNRMRAKSLGTNPRVFPYLRELSRCLCLTSLPSLFPASRKPFSPALGNNAAVFH